MNDRICWSRRQLLGAGVVGGLTLAAGFGGTATAAPPPHPLDRLIPTLYGPAALTSAVRGAAVQGDRVHLLSRFVTDKKLLRVGTFDLNTGAHISTHDLDLGAATGSVSARADDKYVYLGIAASPSLWRFDPASGEVVAFATVGGATTWAYDIVLDGDDLLVGTYPACRLLRVSRSTGAVTDLGRVGTSMYCTAIASDETNVYAATAAPGQLNAYPRDGSAPVDMTPLLSPSPVGVLGLAAAGGLLYISCGREVISMRPDGSERVARTIAPEDRYIDKLFAAADGSVYALARTTTNVYRVAESNLEKIGTPYHDVENTAFEQRPDGSFVGATGLGQFWRMQPSGEAQVWESADSFGYPEPAQSMLAHTSGAVWVGGHSALTVHDQLRTPAIPGAPAPKHRTRRIHVNGEPKSITQGPDGSVYLALYPSTDVVRIDSNTLGVTKLTTIDNEQMRPMNMHFDAPRNQLVIGTTAKQRVFNGGVSFVNASTGETQVLRDVLPDQQVRGFTIADGIGYAAGDTYAEGSSTPRRATAQLAAIDLATREVLWRAEPIAAVKSYENVLVVGRTLYALCRRPRIWLSLDLGTGQVTGQGELGGYGGLGTMDGRVFSWVHWALAIDELPSAARPADAPTRLYEGVPAGWYNNATFATVPKRNGTWGMYGTDLGWFPLGR